MDIGTGFRRERNEPTLVIRKKSSGGSQKVVAPSLGLDPEDGIIVQSLGWDDLAQVSTPDFQQARRKMMEKNSALVLAGEEPAAGRQSNNMEDSMFPHKQPILRDEKNTRPIKKYIPNIAQGSDRGWQVTDEGMIPITPGSIEFEIAHFVGRPGPDQSIGIDRHSPKAVTARDRHLPPLAAVEDGKAVRSDQEAASRVLRRPPTSRIETNFAGGKVLDQGPPWGQRIRVGNDSDADYERHKPNPAEDRFEGRQIHASQGLSQPN